MFVYGDFFINLLIMLNPLALIFPFLSMTETYSSAEREALLKKAIIFSLTLLISVFLIGKFVIVLLNLSLYSFVIVGGLFFLKTGYDILSKTEVGEEVVEVGIIPVGFPLIAGPGSLTLLLIYSTKLKASDIPPSIAVILLSIAITFLLLRYSTTLVNHLSPGMIKGISKGIGLIVMVIGVQIILNGITMWIQTELINST